MRRAIRQLLLSALLALVLASPVPAAAQPAPCRFVLGFAELAAMLRPAIVGQCAQDQQVQPFGATQNTTRGAMFWIRHRNVSFFVDAADVVWINGPYGLERREINEYFAWEVANGQAPLISVPGQPSAPVAGQPPASSQPVAPGRRPMTRNELEAACFGDYATTLGLDPSRPANEAEAEAVNYLCGEAIAKDGELGLKCYREAYKVARALSQALPGSSQAATAYENAYAACIARG